MICLCPMSQAYERAFEQTAVGTIEIKLIPAAKVIMSQTEGHYFKHNNGLFRPLFRYIRANDIAMTIPVEAEINPGTMYFYISGEDAKRELKSTDQVDVLEMPERTVVSLGIRGSYSQSNFDEAKRKLEQWLARQNQYKATGAARAIYWNGPFTLGLLKRAEVHIPVIANTQ